MLDISQSLKALQHVKEVHIVAIKNDCKEVLYLIDKAATVAPTIHTINFSSTGEERFTFDTPAQREIGYSKPSEFLYEPNTAIMKSGRMDDLAAHFPLAKLHPNTQLFTSQEHLTNFPGRAFRIEQVIPYSKKELKKAVADGKANITVRNFKDDVKSIRKKTGLKDGGKVYLFACTDVNNKPIIIKCFKT